ncbi:MAG: hypothetical protein VYA68_08885 [Pseudomonadota bacterium]|nr:hypothetical protein [Pseudomonadota bacterium]
MTSACQSARPVGDRDSCAPAGAPADGAAMVAMAAAAGAAGSVTVI